MLEVAGTLSFIMWFISSPIYVAVAKIIKPAKIERRAFRNDKATELKRKQRNQAWLALISCHDNWSLAIQALRTILAPPEGMANQCSNIELGFQISRVPRYGHGPRFEPLEVQPIIR
jgi:hypothetical protein